MAAQQNRWRKAALPGGLLLLVLLLYVLELKGIIPERSRIAEGIESAFVAYGVIVVAIVSFVENIGGLNLYFPGSIAILSSMAMTAGRPFLAAKVFVAIVTFSFLAHSVNYAIGRAGAGRALEGSEWFGRLGEGTRRWGFAVVFWLAAWHPHPTALASLLAGAAGIGYRRYLKWFLPPFFTWNSVWGIAMYIVGGLASEPGLAGFYVGVGAITLWFIVELVLAMRQPTEHT